MVLRNTKYIEPQILHQEYEDRLVVFIDILGFSDMVNQSVENATKVRRLTAALKSLYERK